MKKTLFVIGGVCAAVAGFLVLGAKRVQPVIEPVDELAHRLELAWADHHTVV